MLVSPLVGYFGGKYNRKHIITFGVSIWCLALFMGAQVKVLDGDSKETISSKYFLFLSSRSLFGIGEACYICLATAIIHDMYTTDKERMNMLIIFSMAIPVGSGLGYILGAQVADWLGNWQYATIFNLPVTIAVLAFWVFYVPDVPHGYSDIVKGFGKDGLDGEEMIEQKHLKKKTSSIATCMQEQNINDEKHHGNIHLGITHHEISNSSDRIPTSSSDHIPIGMTESDHPLLHRPVVASTGPLNGAGDAVGPLPPSNGLTKHPNPSPRKPRLNSTNSNSLFARLASALDDENSLVEGESEDSEPKAEIRAPEPITLKTSLWRLWRNNTYVYTTIGFTAVCFSLGAGTTFIPILFQRSSKLSGAIYNEKYINEHGWSDTKVESYEKANFSALEQRLQGDAIFDASAVDVSSPSPLDQEFTEQKDLMVENQKSQTCGQNDSSNGMMVFGAIATLSGLLGAYFGGTFSQKWKDRGNVSSETDVCAIGVLFGAVFLYVCFIVATMTPVIYYSVFFVGLTCINLTWAVINKIILSVVHPMDKTLGSSLLRIFSRKKKSKKYLKKMSFFLFPRKSFPPDLITHALGDVISPVIVGGLATIIGKVIHDLDQPETPETPAPKDPSDYDPFVDYLKLQQALMLVPIVCALGSLSFFTASLYYNKDLSAVEAFHRQCKGSPSSSDKEDDR